MSFHGHQYAARLPVRGYAFFLNSVQDFAQLVIQVSSSAISCSKMVSGFDYVNLSISVLVLSVLVPRRSGRFGESAATRAFNASLTASGCQSQRGLPASFTRSLIALDNNLLLLVTEYHRAQHSVFAQQFSFGFHHQLWPLRYRQPPEVQLAFFQLVWVGFKHVLVGKS